MEGKHGFLISLDKYNIRIRLRRILILYLSRLINPNIVLVEAYQKAMFSLHQHNNI